MRRPHREIPLPPSPSPSVWGTLGSGGPGAVTGFPSCASTSCLAHHRDPGLGSNDRAPRGPGLRRGGSRRCRSPGARPARRRVFTEFLRQRGARPRGLSWSRRECSRGVRRVWQGAAAFTSELLSVPRAGAPRVRRSRCWAFHPPGELHGTSALLQDVQAGLGAEEGNSKPTHQKRKTKANGGPVSALETFSPRT